jgi:NTP pyrophosphatase (non-canonical NTP hydrolase)
MPAAAVGIAFQSAATGATKTMNSPSPADPAASPKITLADFQRLIRDMYFEKDLARGIDGTFMWLMEEVGELAAALRGGTHEERLGEFADVLAWLATIANVAGVDLSAAIASKYGSGCPGCGQLVCACADAEKP